jgi:hypothetical protein
MTTTEIQPAFDADLQPIGYALAAELMSTYASRLALPSGPDLFGWELAPQAHDGAIPAGPAADWATDRAYRSGPIATPDGSHGRWHGEATTAS